MRLVIIGGGMLGTAHAFAAVTRGHEVSQLERDPQARGASVRDFGLLRISASPAEELDAALRSRRLWEEIGGRIAAVGFRPIGSITLIRTDLEWNIARAAVAGPDAEARGIELLEPERVRAINPALRGAFLAGLYCATDAAVESGFALPALRAYLTATGRYTFHPSTEARSVLDNNSGATVVDDHGRTFPADLVVHCPGAAHAGLTRELVGEIPVRRVRTQMMQTAPLGEPLGAAVADGDSFRRHPGFAGPEVDLLDAEQSQTAIAAEHAMGLLCVQRLHGGLTIGGTHEYADPRDPLPFHVDEAPYEHLTRTTEELLGRRLPPVTRRWAGVHSESAASVTRVRAADHIWVVTGSGERGMALAPFLGEETADLLGL